MSEFKQFLFEKYGEDGPTPDSSSPITKIKGETAVQRVTEAEARPLESPVVQVDPDTVKVAGQSYRLHGFNAPETAKPGQGGLFIPPQVAADNTGEIVNRIAKLGGYDTLQSTGARDPYGRIIAKQVNSSGQSLGDTLTKLNITPTTRYTDPEVAARANYTAAVMAAMPDMARADPILRIAMDEAERRKKELAGRPSHIAGVDVQNPAQFAAIKNMVGTKAVKEHVAEIDRIQGLLNDPSLETKSRAKLNKMLDEARDRLWMSARTQDFAATVTSIPDDRNLMNQAKDQFTVSLKQGLLDLQKGLYGMGEIVGDTAGWDWLSNKAKSETTMIKAKQGVMPDTLSSYKDIKGRDSWETIANTGTYVSNLVAGTLPSLVVMGAGAVASGGMSVIPSILATTAPMAIAYSGQYYADQPDDKKNAELAVSFGIASAALDRLGLEGMLLKGGNLFNQVGRKEVIQRLKELGKAATDAEAEALLKNATRASIMEVAKFGTDFAAKHYASKAAMMAAIKSISLAAGGEAITESAQQTLQMIAQTGEVDPDIRYEKYFYEGLIDAAIGGGVMGGAFKVGGVAMDAARWHSAAAAKAHFEGQLNDYMQYQAEQRQRIDLGETDAFKSTLDGIAKSVSKATTSPAPTLDELPVKKGVWNGFMSIVKDPVRVLRSLADTTIRNIRKPDGTFATYKPVILSIMKAGVLPGDHFDGFRQRLIGYWNTETAESLATRLKTSVYDVDRRLKHAWDTVWSKGGTLDRTDPNLNALQEWKDEADAVTRKAFDMMVAMGADVSQFDSGINAIFEESAVDLTRIAKNRQLLVNTMMKNKSSQAFANQAVDNLISGDPTLSAPAKRWMQKYGVFSDPKTSQLFEPNIFTGFENFKNTVASSISKQMYLGRDGGILAKLLHLAKENGEFASEEEYIDTATNLRDFYKIATGTYHSLENYPFIEKVLGWGVTMTMLASLGKAALSSIPEAGISTLGTAGETVNAQLHNAAKTFVREIRNDINAGLSYTTSTIGYHYAREHPDGKIREKLLEFDKELEALQNNPNATLEQHQAFAKKVKQFYKKEIGRSLFERLGYNDSGYNTQTKFETASANMKRTMQVFARLIGLRAVTDTTRIAALSVAADIMRTRLEILRAIPEADRIRRFGTGEDLTNEQFHALKELQKYGMDVVQVLRDLDMVAANTQLDPNETPTDAAVLMTGWSLDTDTSYKARLEDALLTGIRNMVDSKVVNPQMANLPKYYHDPRLRIFTAMTRFIAGLTANILPRLYKDYVKDGHAGMRYQAFAVMAQAMVFAHLSAILKDILSYGDDESPYIKSNVKKAQRALYGSGLLGRMESAVDMVSPLYDFKSPSIAKNPVGAAWSGLKNSAAPISWADKVVQAAYNIGTGDTAKGVKYAVRAAPLAGSFPVVASTASKLVDEGNK